MDDDNWDLQAVVRGCAAALSSTSTPSTTTTTTSTTTKPSCSSSFQQQLPPPFFQLQAQQTNQDFCGFSDLFEPRKNEYYLLNDVYNPLMFSSSSSSSPSIHDQCFPISSLSVLGGLQDLASQQQQEQKLVQGKQQAFGVIRSTTSHAQSTRLKKRKNQMKRMCHVPAEGLSSDMWSWRKYGQKPIKGSPYPRGYYRCSTSKGCLARKQVERNRSDPGMFIVTYTGEHNHPIPTHRNSLAGSTRQKPVSSGDDKPTSSPPVSPSSASLSPGKTEENNRDEEREEMIEEDEDDDENFGNSEMGVDDDFFDGLDELVPPVTGDCLSDHFPASLTFPWLSSTTTTAAGGS